MTGETGHGKHKRQQRIDFQIQGGQHHIADVLQEREEPKRFWDHVPIADRISYTKIRQFNAEQIYAKAKEVDKQIGNTGTYPDLALTKGLELMPNGTKNFCVKSSTSINVDELKRIIHKNMFASINMMVTRDIYDLDSRNFVYEAKEKKVGGHSIVCCGYDEESKMFIVQNHWGTIWGLKGFFLCPYSVWKNLCNLICWYEHVEAK